jgi:hypothetical protein
MRRIVLALAMTVLSVGAASAQVGYFSDNPGSYPTLQNAIATAGQVGVQLNDLTAADLAGIRVLDILNSNNAGYPAQVTNNLAAINAFVAGGGVLSFSDRGIGNNTQAVIPGAALINFVRDFTDDATINVINSSTLVTNGPGGVLVSGSLSGGTSSSHGYVTAASIPAGGVGILSQTDPTHVVDFYYPFGAGWVYYSSMPLDYYLSGNGPDPPRSNFNLIYAPNEIAFEASLLVGVPEPSTVILATAGLGIVGAIGYRQRRRKSRRVVGAH